MSCAAPARRCPWLVPALLLARLREGDPTGAQGDGASQEELLSGRAALCLSGCWHRHFRALLCQQHVWRGDFGGFPSLLWRKPFQPPNAGSGRGPAVPAGVPGSRGRLLTSRGIFSSGLTGPPYVCVLLFPFAFYVLSRCREEWRSLPVAATVRFCCLVFCSPLLGGFPELCL